MVALKTPRRTKQFLDVDMSNSFLNAEEGQDRKSLLRKSIVRVKKHERSFNMETELEITAKREQKMQFLQNTFYGKNKHLIEDFFIIGMDKENEIENLERQYLNKSPNKIFLPSQVLYMHSNNKDCQRRNVVKDFCFPNENSMQLTLEKLSSKDEVQ